VSFGFYARVLFVLGMPERLTELADVRSDALGLAETEMDRMAAAFEHEDLKATLG